MYCLPNNAGMGFANVHHWNHDKKITMGTLDSLGNLIKAKQDLVENPVPLSVSYLGYYDEETY